MRLLIEALLNILEKIVQEQLILTLGLTPESWQSQAVRGLCVI